MRNAPPAPAPRATPGPGNRHHSAAASPWSKRQSAWPNTPSTSPPPIPGGLLAQLETMTQRRRGGVAGPGRTGSEPGSGQLHRPADRPEPGQGIGPGPRPAASGRFDPGRPGPPGDLPCPAPRSAPCSTPASRKSTRPYMNAATIGLPSAYQQRPGAAPGKTGRQALTGPIILVGDGAVTYREIIQ